MSQDSKEEFGLATPIGRCGQPVEVATCFVFLASADSSYMRCVFFILYKYAFLTKNYSGQVLHPNGGVVIA